MQRCYANVSNLFHQLVQFVIESQWREISDLNFLGLHENASLLETLKIASPAYATVVLSSGFIQLDAHPNWLQIRRKLSITLQLAASASDGDRGYGPNKANCPAANMWRRRGQNDGSPGLGNTWRNVMRVREDRLASFQVC